MIIIDDIKINEQQVRWGMMIDLRRCVGCGTCSVTCDQTNHLSYNKWRKVFDCGISEPPERQRRTLPVSCMHCGNPPCLEVCPTKATYRRPDGIINIRYQLCVGCGFCIVACPYHARSIVFQKEFALENGIMGQESGPTADHDRIGVATKCNFCLPKIEAGVERGLLPGIDPEATPMCVISCTARALYFGNLRDPESQVSRLIRENKVFCLQEELRTDPSIFYIMD